MTKRRKSRRKQNQYIKPPRTPEQVTERLRQKGGKHFDHTPRHQVEQRAHNQEDTDNG